MEEHLLIRRCIKGHPSAQKELYERHQSRLFGLCLRYAHSEAEALDFLQEGFIKIFRDLKSFRGDGPLEAWMSRVMVNTAISKLRRKNWIKDDTYDWENMPSDDPEPEPDGLNAEQLIELIQQLPDGFRSVFNLYAIEGYAHKEIAQILNIAESTSRSQYLRARMLLQERIRTLERY
jgi:RNA polymerase sigma-70 factor (ECF subfamily)